MLLMLYGEKTSSGFIAMLESVRSSNGRKCVSLKVETHFIPTYKKKRNGLKVCLNNLIGFQIFLSKARLFDPKNC